MGDLVRGLRLWHGDQASSVEGHDGRQGWHAGSGTDPVPGCCRRSWEQLTAPASGTAAAAGEVGE
jgi:hypothetical protein